MDINYNLRLTTEFTVQYIAKPQRQLDHIVKLELIKIQLGVCLYV